MKFEVDRACFQGRVEQQVQISVEMWNKKKKEEFI